MDVYVMPLAADRYELYCEPGEESEETQHEPHSGFLARWLERFRVKLSQLDRHHGAVEAQPARQNWSLRVRDRAMRWIAEKVAEQRLLWRLRKYRAARAFYPDDLSASHATTIIQRLLQRDVDRHRRWMIFHGIAFLFAFIVLGPFFLLVPGVANLPAAYFAFRLFGHYLSMRGARHGLDGVEWSYAPCPPLSALRRALGSPVPERERFVHEIAARLRLAHLPRFLRQAADHSA